MASTLVGLGLLVAGLAAWWAIVGDVLRALTQSGPLGWLLVLPLALPTAAAWVSLLAQAAVALAQPRSHRPAAAPVGP